MNTDLSKLFMSTVCGVMILACGTSKQNAMLNTIESPSTRPSTLEALAEDLEQGRAEQVHLISPDRFLRAQNLYDESRLMQSRGHSPDTYEEKLKEARSQLDAAMEFSKKYRTQMLPLISAREVALKSGAADQPNAVLKGLEKEYLELGQHLSDVKRRSGAETRIPELTKAYEQLSINTLTETHLGEAKNNLSLTRGEGADDLTPKTYRETVEAIKKAAAFISQSQTASALPMTTELAKTATDKSRRLLFLSRQAKPLKTLSA